MKWESEVDSTFTLPLWKVESERSEVRKWGRLDFYPAVVKSRVGEEWSEKVRYTRLLLCRCEKSSLYSTFTLPLWKVESDRSEVRKWGRLDFYSAVVKSRVYTRLLLCRCEKSSRTEVKWESEVDSTFTLPLWNVESERSEVRTWGRLDFYSAVVKSRVGEEWSEKVRETRLLLCRREKSSRTEVKWESEVDSTFTLPLWKVESDRSEVREWGRLDFHSAVEKSRVYTRLLICRCEKSSRRGVKWESEVDSTFTLSLWKVESEVRKWGRLDFHSAVVKSRDGEKWSEEVR